MTDLVIEIRDNGPYRIRGGVTVRDAGGNVLETDGVVAGDAWSDFIPESAKLTADWTYPWVCGNCTKPKFEVVK